MQKTNHVNCIRLIWQFSPIYGVNLCIQSKYWKVWIRKKLLIWTLVTQCPCQFRFIEACLLCKTFCKTVVIQRCQVLRFFKGINGLIKNKCFNWKRINLLLFITIHTCNDSADCELGVYDLILILFGLWDHF